MKGSVEPLQEHATTLEQLTQNAFSALHENHICMSSYNVFSDGVGDQGTKHKLLLVNKRTVNQAL